MEDGVEQTYGTVVGWDKTNDDVIRYIQDNEFHSDTDNNLREFTGALIFRVKTVGRSHNPILLSVEHLLMWSLLMVMHHPH